MYVRDNEKLNWVHCTRRLNLVVSAALFLHYIEMSIVGIRGIPTELRTAYTNVQSLCKYVMCNLYIFSHFRLIV